MGSRVVRRSFKGGEVKARVDKYLGRVGPAVEWWIARLSGNSRRLRTLQDCHRGRRGFVIGNGPSLRQVDLSKLRDDVTIASNGIFLLFGENDFRPDYYTVEDCLVAEDRAVEINRLAGITKVVPFDLRAYIRRDPATVYANFIREYPQFPRFSDDFAKCAYWGGTVTFFNLQLAWYLGIREIYLVGIDHNYLPKQPEDKQRGNVITSRGDDRNHFHPDYFGAGYRWHAPRPERMEEAYREAKRFADEHGGVIRNATIGGKLEVFERVVFDELF